MRDFSIPALGAAMLVATLAACAPQRAAPPNAGGDIGALALSSGTAEAEADVSKFVPAGTRIRLRVRGDADADGDEDALLVLDDDQDASAGPSRRLMLLRRGADDGLQVAANNPRAVLCRRCGGISGDPLHSIRIESGSVVLRFEGGSRELWSSEFRFAYARGIDQWRLRSVVHAGFDRAEGKNAERALTQDEIGDVGLMDFDASHFPADALP